jgi:hypothetical protein
MKGNQVRTDIAYASVTSIVALILICSLSVSAKGSNEHSEIIDSGKAALQAADNRLTKTREQYSHSMAQRVTLPEDEKGTGSPSLASSMWQPLPDTAVDTAPSGIMTVSSRTTFWAGAIAHPQVSCNYRFDADARLREGGSGYGLAVRASVTDGGMPHGQGIQYDQGMGGLRDVLLPDHSESGTVKSATIDSEWHHISVAVVGNRYESSVDGEIIFSGTTPTTCGNGILIRVWRSTADFRNISITPINDFSAPKSLVRHHLKLPSNLEILSNNVGKSQFQ